MPKPDKTLGNRGKSPETVRFLDILNIHTLRSDLWRPDPESNRGARICNPLRHHSAIGPERGRELLRFGGKVNPNLRRPFLARFLARFLAMHIV